MEYNCEVHGCCFGKDGRVAAGKRVVEDGTRGNKQNHVNFLNGQAINSGSPKNIVILL